MRHYSTQQGGSMTWLVIVIALVVILGIYFMFVSESNQDTSGSADEQTGQIDESPENLIHNATPTFDAGVMEVDEARLNVMKELTYQYEAALEDVTDGQIVRGVTTNNQASGRVIAGTSDDFYILLASFTNLPDPVGTEYYEGWLVRREPLSVVSTGRVTKTDGVYTQAYLSTSDLTDHTMYVLTVEPNDSNAAPADHILEGDLALVDQGVKYMSDTVLEENSEMIDGESMQEGDESAVRVFDITGVRFAFSQEEIQVNQGDTVRINFTSEEGLHDWVLDEFDAATERVSDGENTFVEFVADTKGTYEFYCSVESHREQGMVGTLIVE